jgi:hypothetical protein
MFDPQLICAILAAMTPIPSDLIELRARAGAGDQLAIEALVKAERARTVDLCERQRNP